MYYFNINFIKQILLSINLDRYHTANELLLLIQQEHEGAFEQLYFRYYSQLCSKAFKRISNEPGVEEVVQDVFFSLWCQAKKLDHQGNVCGWLYAVLRNKVLHA